MNGQTTNPLNKRYIAIAIAVAALVIIVVGVVWLARTPLIGLKLAGIFGGGEAGSEAAPSSASGQPSAQPPYVPKDGVLTQVSVPLEKQADYIIDITAIGFSPAELDIKSGQSVIWTNRNRNLHWVASSTKNPYPEKGSCGSKFNSCRGLKLGESFRLTFETRGRWEYSDKLNPQFTGVVIVN
jgi:plastocyanin